MVNKSTNKQLCSKINLQLCINISTMMNNKEQTYVFILAQKLHFETVEINSSTSLSLMKADINLFQIMFPLLRKLLGDFY